MEKRSRIMFISFVFIFVFLLFMILRIIVFDKQKYMSAATNQHLDKTSVKIFRGMIYDKNLIPLTDSRGYVLNHKNNVKYSITKRYDEKSRAKHITGYVNNENEGVSGIEKMYNELLKTTGSFEICSINNVNDKDVLYLPKTIKKNEFLSNGIKLTLDYHIQKIAEDIFDKHNIEGAAVVLDVESFDVLGMVSKPDFDQTKIEKHINEGEAELVNKAISGFNAGSIFKIITTAAAIENGIANKDDLFFCPGLRKIDGNIFNCNKKDGHKFLTFEDAFAKSCNVCFYDLGVILKKDKLYDMANKFSLGQKVLDFEGEDEGSIDMGEFDADMANTSIGQGKILITPIQAAKIAAIIATGGYEKNVNIVSGVVDKSGNFMQSLRYDDEKKVISTHTADAIKNMMKNAVDNGTGISAYDENLNICGKTGSAETGWLKDDKLMVHGWFVGFFPYEKPKYAMSVFLQNGQSGQGAAKIFLEIAKEIEKYGM